MSEHITDEELSIELISMERDGLLTITRNAAANDYLIALTEKGRRIARQRKEQKKKQRRRTRR